MMQFFSQYGSALLGSLLFHGVGVCLFLMREDPSPLFPPPLPGVKVYFVTLAPEIIPEVVSEILPAAPLSIKVKSVAVAQKKSPALHVAMASQEPLLASTVPPHYQAGSLKNPLPSYPYISRKRGEEGQIICVVKVNPQGQAEHIDIQESSGFERLDQAVQKTLQAWVFEPAYKGSQKIYGVVQISITFRLTEGVKI